MKHQKCWSGNIPWQGEVSKLCLILNYPRLLDFQAEFLLLLFSYVNKFDKGSLFKKNSLKNYI